MLRFKNGVEVPQVTIIIAAVYNAYTALGFKPDCYVTSGNDGVHMPGSKHYTNEAADFRTRNLTPDQITLWAKSIRLRLGENYDVVIEGDHIHVERDDK